MHTHTSVIKMQSVSNVKFLFLLLFEIGFYYTPEFCDLAFKTTNFIIPLQFV